MKKTMLALMVTSLLAAAPVMADTTHGAMHNHQDEQCAKECELLLKNCALEVDSIQQRMQKIQAAIKENGAKPADLENLKILSKKLKETNETLRTLQKPGH